jgi:drug/metabolite transporter (DMT)-like permease
MILPILSKLVSESLLSLYPIFVKKIGLTMQLQMWTRMLAYVAISALFVNWTIIKNALFTKEGIGLAFINMFHVFFSYEGFKYLDSGVSFAIFNTYPLIILLLSGVVWNKSYAFVLLALAFFVYDEIKSSFTMKSTLNPEFIYGLIMILLAALTEAFIYFLIKMVKTTNHWNHVFISYAIGLIIMSVYVVNTENIIESISNARVALATGLNGIIGSVGYFLRFYAAYRLDAGIYSVLSYFGIIMSYVYGILFNNESLSLWKVLGTLSIFVSKALL